jgi:hypothetical protein
LVLTNSFNYAYKPTLFHLFCFQGDRVVEDIPQVLRGLRVVVHTDAAEAEGGILLRAAVQRVTVVMVEMG